MTNLATRGMGRTGGFLATSGLGRGLPSEVEKIRPYGDRWHDHGPRIQQEDEEMIILLRAITEVISCH